MHQVSIVTSRFTNETWNENVNYREKNTMTGCIYGSPSKISSNIQLGTPVFVVEMNNTTNKIEGIGLICNFTNHVKTIQVYETKNYNRYVYTSKYRLSREVLNRYDSNLVNGLEQILFKGKTHLKRGSGFTTIPPKLLNSDICKNMDMKTILVRMFKSYFE
jgi:hypothetical protein